MKKIILLLGALIAVVATLTAGTWAYFSDTESTASNTITAGILDLTRDGASEVTTAFIDAAGYDNVSPGDAGEDSTLLANYSTSTASGELDINLGNVSQTAGAAGPEFAGGSDLGTNLYVAIWLDKDNLGSWNSDDVGLTATANTKQTYVAGISSTTTAAGSTTTLVDTALTQADDYWNGFKVTIGTRVGVVTDFVQSTNTLTVTAFPASVVGSGKAYSLSGPKYYPIASFDDLGNFDNVLTVQKAGTAGDDWDFVIDYMVPVSVGNSIQGDTATFDSIVFTLEQAAAD
jgi:spore coat-associated protein N